MQNWLIILITAGLTTLGTILVTAFSHWLALRRQRQTNANEREPKGRFVAMRIVSLLDSFIIKCADVAADCGADDATGQRITTTADPDLVYPADLDWTVIEHDYMYRSLALLNEVSVAKELISKTAEMDSPPWDDVFLDRRRHFSNIGIEALKLADSLREKYAIPPARYLDIWSPSDTLTHSQAQVATLIKQRGDQNAAFRQNMADDVKRILDP